MNATAQEVVISFAGLSRAGPLRANNQDAMLAADLSLHRSVGEVWDPVREFGDATASHRIVLGPKGALFLVADGLGGENAGEVASRLAVEATHAEVISNWVATAEPTVTLASALEDAVVRANARVFAQSSERDDWRGMGTTLTAAAVIGEHLYLAQVGDSEAYLVRDGHAIKITRDQSVAAHLIRAGRLTEAEARRSPQRHMLLQALGSAPDIVVDLSVQAIRRGDWLVLCTDGLSKGVTQPELAKSAGSASTPSDMCLALMRLAASRQVGDNVSLLVLAFSGPGLRLRNPTEVVGYEPYPRSKPGAGSHTTPGVTV